MGISGFQDMGPVGAMYEGTCQGIAADVLEWFQAHPEKVEEAIETNDVYRFCKAHDDLMKLICKYNPSAAQAGAAFWTAVNRFKNVESSPQPPAGGRVS